MADTQRVFDGMLALLPDAKRGQNGWWNASCPCHEDRHASFGVVLNADGVISLKCHAGCEKPALLQRFGLEWADLFPDRDRDNGHKPARPAKLGRIVATYDYTDEHGALLYQATRHDPKDFRQRRPDGHGGWINSLGDARRVLYRLPELATVQPGQWVFVVEGEKSADALREMGAVATCNPMGAGKWLDAYTEQLEGCTVIVLADNDAAGLKHAYSVAADLLESAESVRVLNPGDGCREHYDVADWLQDGGAWAELVRLIEATPQYSGEQAPVMPIGGVHNTDMGNAARLVALHGADLRYCKRWGRWLVWDGSRWADDDTDEVWRRAMDVPRQLYLEAGKATDDDERKAAAKWAIRSETATRIAAMVTLARAWPGVPIVPDDLDGDPWLLNVENGTVDLRTGELRPHRRADRITKLAPVIYDQDATCPRFDAFLKRVLADNDELIAFVRRAVGYSLTGDTSERALFILHGIGRNGKSTLLEAIRDALGDYALRTPTATLMAQRTDGIPNDVARLKGARFVSASETEDGRRLAEAMIKDLTGGDTISARFMRAEWFEFRPTCKVWLGTNHKPVIRGTDNAIWDRLKLIPFTVRIPDNEIDPHLGDKLREELPGILAWAVRGCVEWQSKKGLNAPAAVTVATDAYRDEMDVLAGFVAECVYQDANAGVTKGALYDAYKRWCEDAGERVQTKRWLGRRLNERGWKEGKNRSGDRAWLGYGLLSDETEPPEAEPRPLNF